MLLQAQGKEKLEFSVREQVEAAELWSSISGPAWSISEFVGTEALTLTAHVRGILH